jgi:fermentation-respiration switch protein FrsA (DUF1100 family)
MFVPEVAEAFQAANITALIYDPRSTGASEGLPRQHIHPQKQIEDYSDALTFLSRHPLVDETRIGFWGFSFAAIVALNSAALDKRAKFVISVCPLTDFTFGGRKSKVLAKTMKDRASQAQGNPPFCLPVLTEAGENPVGFGVGTAKEDFSLILNAEKSAPNYRNSTTLQSYYHIAAWQPFGLLPEIAPTSVLMLTPENDQISLAENQKKIFDSILAPKKRHVEPNKGHMDILSGESFPVLMKTQIDFLKEL